VVSVRRFDVVLVALEPTRGAEMQKTRPCVVVSPDEMNRALRTVIVAPMTTGGHTYPWRVRVDFAGRHGQIALDQIRTVDAERFTKQLGQIDQPTADRVLATLTEMFAR
jgi:mRNA interferase MazF